MVHVGDGLRKTLTLTKQRHVSIVRVPREHDEGATAQDQDHRGASQAYSDDQGGFQDVNDDENDGYNDSNEEDDVQDRDFDLHTAEDGPARAAHTEYDSRPLELGHVNDGGFSESQDSFGGEGADQRSSTRGRGSGEGGNPLRHLSNSSFEADDDGERVFPEEDLAPYGHDGGGRDAIADGPSNVDANHVDEELGAIAEDRSQHAEQDAFDAVPRQGEVAMEQTHRAGARPSSPIPSAEYIGEVDGGFVDDTSLGQYRPLAEAIPLNKGWRVIVQRSNGVWSFATVADFDPWPPEGGTVTVRLGKTTRKALDLSKSHHLRRIRVPKDPASPAHRPPKIKVDDPLQGITKTSATNHVSATTTEGSAALSRMGAPVLATSSTGSSSGDASAQRSVDSGSGSSSKRLPASSLLMIGGTAAVTFARAEFGAVRPFDGFAVKCIPKYAHVAIENEGTLRGAVAIVHRGACPFTEKTKRLAAAGVLAIIFIDTPVASNSSQQSPLAVPSDPDGVCADIDFPVLIVPATAAALLREGTSVAQTPRIAEIATAAGQALLRAAAAPRLSWASLQEALLPLGTHTSAAGSAGMQLHEGIRSAWAATEALTGRTVLHVISANPDITEEVVIALAALELPAGGANDEEDDDGSPTSQVSPAVAMAAAVSSPTPSKTSNQNGVTGVHALHELCGNRAVTFNMVAAVVDLCSAAVTARPSVGIFKNTTAFEVLVNKNDGKVFNKRAQNPCDSKCRSYN